MVKSKRDNTLFLVYSIAIANKLVKEGFTLTKIEPHRTDLKKEVFFFNKSSDLVERVYQLMKEHRRMKYEREKAKWLEARERNNDKQRQKAE